MGDLPFRRVDQLLQGSYAGNRGTSITIHEVESEIWQDIAGKIIASHTQVFLEQRVAVIFADSPVWAHSVNQQRLTLLDSMRSKGLGVDAIRIRNHPPKSRRTNHRSKRKPSPISTDAAHTIEQAAATVDHEPLRAALLRLSRFGSNTDG
jgi:hypothetical protein